MQRTVATAVWQGEALSGVVNHRISKAIVSRAKATNSAIALEDLTGIRKRVNQQPRSKAERRKANSWAFYQLRQFLEYKALRAGVALIDRKSVV